MARARYIWILRISPGVLEGYTVKRELVRRLRQVEKLDTINITRVRDGQSTPPADVTGEILRELLE